MLRYQAEIRFQRLGAGVHEDAASVDLFLCSLVGSVERKSIVRSVGTCDIASLHSIPRSACGASSTLWDYATVTDLTGAHQQRARG